VFVNEEPGRGIMTKEEINGCFIILLEKFLVHIHLEMRGLFEAGWIF